MSADGSFSSLLRSLRDEDSPGFRQISPIAAQRKLKICYLSDTIREREHVE